MELLRDDGADREAPLSALSADGAGMVPAAADGVAAGDCGREGEVGSAVVPVSDGDAAEEDEGDGVVSAGGGGTGV